MYATQYFLTSYTSLGRSGRSSLEHMLNLKFIWKLSIKYPVCCIITVVKYLSCLYMHSCRRRSICWYEHRLFFMLQNQSKMITSRVISIFIVAQVVLSETKEHNAIIRICGTKLSDMIRMMCKDTGFVGPFEFNNCKWSIDLSIECFYLHHLNIFMLSNTKY